MANRIFFHGVMLTDKVRMVSYKKAILEVVKKNDIVCDIGTGSGVLAFFSVLAGAKKVYAVEKDEIIEEARKLAQVNGLEKKIIFIKGDSDKVELPEKVDVITSEIIGSFGVEENLPRFNIDARKRFLKPEGKLVPSWLELYLVPVESEMIWRDNIGLWNKDFYGFDLSSVRNYAVSQRYIIDCSGKVRFLASPFLVSHFNFYENKEIPLAFSGEFAINKNGIFHGLVGYFKAGLSQSVILSTAPEEPITHWQQTFFPIQDAISVENDDRVHYGIKAIPQRIHVFWEWKVSIYRSGVEIASFSQSDFRIEKEELIVGRKDFKPALTQEAEIYRRVLNLCNGNRTIEGISEIIFAEYPEKYRTVKDVSREVVSIVRGKASIM
jgi:precorrin-6B methylase 2